MNKKLIFTILTLFLLLVLQNTTSGQNDSKHDEICFPFTTIEPIAGSVDAIFCGDTLNPVDGSLPDGDYVIEVNGFIQYFNKNGAVDTTLLDCGDVVCITAFTHDLNAINGILNDIHVECLLDLCEFGPDVKELIKQLVCGENDGEPGVNDIEELVGMLDSLSIFPIISIPQAYAILDAMNAQIVNDYGAFCYAGSTSISDTFYGCVSVPIELQSFEGEEANCQMRLNWETASERNFSHFEIQKSHNGAEFHVINKVESISGNTSDGNLYNYVDTKDIKSTNYYRLKIVDEDNSFTYSDIIVINSECTEDNSPTINIYPNPVKGDILSVELFIPLSTNNVKIQITDQLGKFVTEQYTDVTGGFNSLEININKLDVNTIYFLNIQSNDWLTSVKRFVKI